MRLKQKPPVPNGNPRSKIGKHNLKQAHAWEDGRTTPLNRSAVERVRLLYACVLVIAFSLICV
jgi:hypothetical protein